LKFRIKIFCLTPEICSLIQKVLNKYNYEYKCVNTINEFLKKTEDEIINDCENSADIVILDQELDKDFKMVDFFRMAFTTSFHHLGNYS